MMNGMNMMNGMRNPHTQIPTNFPQNLQQRPMLPQQQQPPVTYQNLIGTPGGMAYVSSKQLTHTTQPHPIGLTYQQPQQQQGFIKVQQQQQLQQQQQQQQGFIRAQPQQQQQQQQQPPQKIPKVDYPPQQKIISQSSQKGHSHSTQKRDSSSKTTNLNIDKFLANVNTMYNDKGTGVLDINSAALLHSALHSHLKGIIQKSAALAKRSNMYQGARISKDVLNDMSENPINPMRESRSMSTEIKTVRKIRISARDIFIANKDNFSQYIIYKYYDLLNDTK